MKKFGYALFILAIIPGIISALAADTYCEILFQDDFESDSCTWACTEGQLTRWDAGWISCGTTDAFKAEWKMGPGNNSNNAVYAWKKRTVLNGYRSESMKWLTGGQAKREIYHRWYMKMPSSFNKPGPGIKFWRYLTRPNGQTSHVTYLNICTDTTLQKGVLCVLPDAMARFDLVNVSSFSDGNWHSHELRLKMNNPGQSDGVIEYWLDGVRKYRNIRVAFGYASDEAWTRFGVGIGNVGDEPWNMIDWTAVGFDDVVVSTSYVGLKEGSSRQIYLAENFDDKNYASRGWYDFSSPVIDTDIKYGGSGSLRHDFNVGSNGPTGVIRRHAITATDAIYVRYYIRFGLGWKGFGNSSPHMVYLLTTMNEAYNSLAWTRTTGYIEINGSTSNLHFPTLKLQDSQNIDTGYINQSRCSTENRAANGCNGNCDGHSSGCYQSGGYWFNARVFPPSTSQVVDTNWHKVEAYFKMNSISGGVAQGNGQLKMWWDGALVVNHEDLIIRTGQNAGMQWNQIIIAPWGAESPVAQTFWIDELEVADSLPSGPAAPAGLQILKQ